MTTTSNSIAKPGPGLKPKPGLETLRARIRVLESGGRDRRVLPLGPPALDGHLPGGGLALGALHEIEGARAEWDDGVAAAFCLALIAPLAAALEGPLIWIARRPDLYGAGIAHLGLDPRRFIFVRAGGDGEVLWAMEESLRCARLLAVVGEAAALERSAGRRLQLAAEASGVSAFLLRRRVSAPRRAEAPSAARTRWRVAPLPSGPAPLDMLPGRPRWRVELCRCRGAAPGDFLVEWDDATGDFALAAVLRDGAPAARPPAGRAAGGALRLAG